MLFSLESPPTQVAIEPIFGKIYKKCRVKVLISSLSLKSQTLRVGMIFVVKVAKAICYVIKGGSS